MDELLVVVDPGCSSLTAGKCRRISSPSIGRLDINCELKEILLFLYLPREIIVSVLSYLSATDLARSAQVSKEWRIWAYDEILWKTLCMEGVGEVLKGVRSDGKTWRELYIHYALHPKFIACYEETMRILEKGIAAKVKTEGWPVHLGYKTALSSSWAESGVHFWRVQLRPKLLGWLSIIGVVNEHVLKGKLDVNTSMDELPGSFGYFYDGKVVHYTNGARSITHGCGYGPGDIIMMLLDLNKRKLVFHVCSANSSKITHVTTFENIQPGKYRLAVSLNYQDTEVILLENIPPPPEIIPFEGLENHKFRHHI
jgi:hypothetical protein